MTEQHTEILAAAIRVSRESID